MPTTQTPKPGLQRQVRLAPEEQSYVAPYGASLVEGTRTVIAEHQQLTDQVRRLTQKQQTDQAQQERQRLELQKRTVAYQRSLDDLARYKRRLRGWILFAFFAGQLLALGLIQPLMG